MKLPVHPLLNVSQGKRERSAMMFKAKPSISPAPGVGSHFRSSFARPSPAQKASDSCECAAPRALWNGRLRWLLPVGWVSQDEGWLPVEKQR